MRFWLLGFLALVIGAATFRQAQDQRIDAHLQTAAAEYRRRLPFIIEHHTRIDQITTEPGRVIVYRATLLDVIRDQSKLAAKAQTLKPKMIEMYRASEPMKLFRDLRVTLKFRYYDWWGHFLTEIVIAPGDLNS